MSGVTRFTGIAEAQAVGQPEVERLAGTLDKLSTSLDNLGKKSEQVKPPKWEVFAASAKNFIQNPLDAAGDAAEGFLRKIGPMGAGVSVAAAGMGVLAKIGFDAAKSLGEYGDRIGDTAVRLGMSTKEVQQFSFAMKYAGGDISTVEAAVRTLSRGLAANDEEGKKVKATLKSMGVDAAAPISQVLLQLSERLNGMTTAAERNTAAMNLFGRAGLELLPDLLGLSEGLRREKQLDVGATEAQIKKYDEYRKKVVEIEAAWEKLKREMKEPIAGVVLVVVKKITDERGNNPQLSPEEQAAVSAQRSQEQTAIEARRNQRNREYGAEPGGENFLNLNKWLSKWRPTWESRLDYMQEAAEQRVSVSRGKAMQDQIRKAWGLTKEGIEETIKKTRADLAEAREKVFEPGLRENVVLERKADVTRLEGKERSQQAQLDAINNAEKTAKEHAELALKGRQHIEYYRVLIARAAAGPVGSVSSEFGITTGTGAREFNIVDLDKNIKENQPDYAKLFTNSLEAQIRADQEAIGNLKNAISVADQATRGRIEANISGMRSGAQHQGRILELMADPGREVQALQQALSLRVETARAELEMKRARADVFDMAKEEAVFEREAQQARYEYEEKILELRKQGLQEWKSSVMSAYDALIAGGDGLSSFLKSQLVGIGRTAAGNLAEMTYKSGRFSLPGQGTADNPNFLGKLLQGTPLGLDPLKGADIRLSSAGDRLHMSAMDLTGAARALASAGTGGGIPSGAGGWASAARYASPWLSASGTPIQAATGAARLSLYDPTNPVVGPSSSSAVPHYDPSTGTVAGRLPASSRYAGLYRGVGIAGAGIAGAYGAYSGFSAGGAQGALTGTASILGSAGILLPMLSKTLSFAGPIGMIAGMGLGLVASWLGNPKQKRSEDLERQAEARAFTMPTGTSYSYDVYGRGYDYNFMGQMRPIVNYYDQRSYNAIDAPSFVEWGRKNPAAVAEVNAASVTSGNGDDFVGAVRDRLQL